MTLKSDYSDRVEKVKEYARARFEQELMEEFQWEELDDASALNDFDAEVSGVLATLDKWFERDANAFEAMANEMDQVISVLSNTSNPYRSVDSLMDDIDDVAGEWQGDAAWNFADKFTTPFKGCKENQALLAHEIKGLYIASGEVVERSQKGALAILDEVTRQLGYAPPGEELSWSEFLLVAGTVFSVAGTIAGAVAATKITASIVFSLISTGANQVGAAAENLEAAYAAEQETLPDPVDSPPQLIGGYYVRDILYSILDADSNLASTVQAEEDAIRGIAEKNTEAVIHQRDLMFPPEPNLLGTFSPSDFRA